MKTRNVIYADNAATTKVAPLALEAMAPFMTNGYGNPSALYTFGKKAREAVENARQQIAECIGAMPSEIFFTSCGTESDNWAVKGVARALRKKGAHLIASAIDHHAVLKSLAALEMEGYDTTQLPVDRNGIVTVEVLNACITSQTTLVSVILANNEIGTIQDIASLASAAQQQDALFHSDAVQALGHIPVNVAALGVDLLSGSAHKFNGPKGVGFLYKRTGVYLPPYLDGGHQESDNRAGTENVAGIVGMASALATNLAKLERNRQHLQRMDSVFKDKIERQIPEAKFNGHPTRRLPGLVSLSLPSVSGESLLHILDLRGIYVSTGAACTSRDTVTSHVLDAIKAPASHSKGTLRISFSSDNTDADAGTVAETIIELYVKLRKGYSVRTPE